VHTLLKDKRKRDFEAITIVIEAIRYDSGWYVLHDSRGKRRGQCRSGLKLIAGHYRSDTTQDRIAIKLRPPSRNALRVPTRHGAKPKRTCTRTRSPSRSGETWNPELEVLEELVVLALCFTPPTLRYSNPHADFLARSEPRHSPTCMHRSLDAGTAHDLCLRRLDACPRDPAFDLHGNRSGFSGFTRPAGPSHGLHPAWAPDHLQGDNPVHCRNFEKPGRHQQPSHRSDTSRDTLLERAERYAPIMRSRERGAYLNLFFNTFVVLSVSD